MNFQALNPVPSRPAAKRLAVAGLSVTLLAFTGVAFAAAQLTALPVSAGKSADTSATANSTPATATWGSFYKPFAADSLWNSKPVKPVFGTFVIPKSDYFPAIAAGAYSTGAFLASATDPAVDVYGLEGRKGVWDPDTEIHKASVRIPHWPADTTPATGTDGHADIIDPIAKIVHSFWYLRKDATTGKWMASDYSWAPLDGTGWPDTAHYYQGARVVGVPPLAGLIRKHEIKDGNAIYNHALAMSLTFNGLAASPAYIFPATSADWNAAWPKSASTRPST